MHSKRRYKICICSVILGQLESVRNYKGFSIIFPKILDAIKRITKKKFFLIPLSSTLHHIFEFENLSFPFSYDK